MILYFKDKLFNDIKCTFVYIYIYELRDGNDIFN